MADNNAQIPIEIGIKQARDLLLTQINQVMTQFNLPLPIMLMILRQIVSDTELASANDYIKELLTSQNTIEAEATPNTTIEKEPIE